MARMNRNIAVWMINLLDIKPNDTVLEIGFGPGTAIGQMADLGLGRQICGIDYSPEMPQQATARNMEAIKSGRVDLRFGVTGDFQPRPLLLAVTLAGVKR